MYRKNTASQFFSVAGIDSTTGGIKSGVTWTVRRCIDGTFAAAGGTATEDGVTGGYKFAMTQADTNGNNISFFFTGTGAVPQMVNIVTTAADPTNATTFGLTNLDAAVSTRLASASYTAPSNLTAGQIATGVWQDTTASDFTTALSVGKSIMNGVALGTGLTIAAVSGAVGSVTGAVGSVTGNVGGSVASVTGAVGSVTAGVTVTTNNDKTGYALTSAEENAIADALLARNVAGGSSTGRVVKEAFYFLRNKWTVSAGTLTVFQTDDSTSSWTATVGTDGAALPIVSNDPA